MAELYENQIEQISTEIDQQGLTYTPLKNELLDHICCQIELEMDQGKTFNEAYRKVRAEMGRKRIRKIQDDTLTLISKKYRRMKRTMYGLGVAAPILIIVAILFKAYHWPGAGIMVTLALFITGVIFLPLFVMVRIRDTRRMDETVPLGIYLTGMISGMFSIIGALFKVQHWPGAAIMIALGLVGFALVFLPMYARYKIKEAQKDNKPVNKNLWVGGTIVGMLVILGMLFKIMHWPGAGITLLISWSLVAVVFLPLLVLNQLRQSENRINNFFGMLVVAVTVSIFMIALMRSTPQYYSIGYVVMENSSVGQANYFKSRTGDWTAGPGNEVSTAEISGDATSVEAVTAEMETFRAESDALCDYLQSLREELATIFSSEEAEPVTEKGAIDPREMSYYGTSTMPYEFIADRDENRLGTMLDAYRTHALQLTDDEALIDFINTQFSFNRPEEMDQEKWNRFCFTGPLMHSITILGTFESTIRLVEREIVNASI